jgi:hypothetical protein
MTDEQLLSAECQAVADALRSVRERLVQMVVREGHRPEGSFADLTTIQVVGVDVIAALERSARGSEPHTRTPTHLDDRY